jgi:hypothetical protein
MGTLTPGVIRAIFALGMAFQQSNATNLEETLEALTDEDWRELDVKPDEVNKAVELLIWAEVIKEQEEERKDSG